MKSGRSEGQFVMNIYIEIGAPPPPCPSFYSIGIKYSYHDQVKMNDVGVD